ncbi:MAG: CBS domain-containing protein, partial [Actinomycetota bacterium]
MNRTVMDVMTRTVVTIDGSAPFKEVVRLMDEFRVSALPVVDEGRRVIGIVSQADLLWKEEQPARRTGRPLFEGRRRRAGHKKAAASVAAQLMTTPVVTIERDASVAEAARLMNEKRVKRLPVVDAEGRIVGIVSRADLLQVFLRPDVRIRDEIVRSVIQEILSLDPSAFRVEVEEGRVITVPGKFFDVNP